MKRQGTGRVLTFAVTGALLGGVGIGGCSKHRGTTVNVAHEEPPEPAVNPGPTDVAQPEPEPDHVNEGPVDEPEPEPEPPHTNVAKQPEPAPKPNVNPGPA